MGCCGSKTRYDRLSQELESVAIAHDSEPSPSHQITAEVAYENEYEPCSGRKSEEREFFHAFFSALTNSQGYQGILRRWEKEAQRADCSTEGKILMQKVWGENIGYIKTLQTVQYFTTMKVFSWSARSKMAEWSAKVVKRRSREYYSAKSQGRADNKHKVVLDEWKKVVQILG